MLNHAISSTSLRRALGAIALLLAFAGSSTALQAGTLGGIAGTVTDAKTGAPIPGVHLKIVSPSEAVTATTDSHGHFSVMSLQPDDYTLTAEKSGYQTSSDSGYSVYADQTQQYDLTLTPAAPSPPGS
jgi:Carboxypeptidase regulatory-like domain